MLEQIRSPAHLEERYKFCTNPKCTKSKTGWTGCFCPPETRGELMVEVGELAVSWRSAKRMDAVRLLTIFAAPVLPQRAFQVAHEDLTAREASCPNPSCAYRGGRLYCECPPERRKAKAPVGEENPAKVSERA